MVDRRAVSNWLWAKRRRLALGALLLVQLLCVLFFVYDLFGGALGLRRQPISWFAHELIEIAALVAMLIGIVVSGIALFRLDARRHAAESRVKEVSRAFHELLEDRFDGWGLTPAERDVALFVVKGFSLGEIAGFRQTSEGTVKAQTAAIYRKAGVSGRAQLVTLFIDHLMDDSAEDV